MSEEYVSLVSQMTAEQQSLEETLKVTEAFVKKFYLEDLQDFSVQAPLSKINNITYANRIRLFHIKGIVINKSEKNVEKLNNVFGALHSLGLSLVTLLEFDHGNVSLYMGIKSMIDIAAEDELNNVFEKVLLFKSKLLVWYTSFIVPLLLIKIQSDKTPLAAFHSIQPAFVMNEKAFLKVILLITRFMEDTMNA